MYTPVACLTDAQAMAFLCGGGPVSVVDMLVETGKAPAEFGQAEVEDHVEQGQFDGVGKGVECGAVEAEQFMAEAVDMLSGEGVDLGIGQTQIGVGGKVGGTMTLAVGAGAQGLVFLTDGVGCGSQAGVSVDKGQSGGVLFGGQQMANPNGNVATRVAVHVGNAAFQLFQVLRDGGTKCGLIHVTVLCLSGNPCRLGNSVQACLMVGCACVGESAVMTRLRPLFLAWYSALSAVRSRISAVVSSA